MADQYFPSLAGKDRESQIMAARELSVASLRPGAVEDFRLELTDNGRWTALRQLGKTLPART